MILPANDSQMVTEFLNLINLRPETLLRITVDPDQLGQVSASSLIKFPGANEKPITAHELFTYWLNLSEAPSRHFCHILGTFLLKREATHTD